MMITKIYSLFTRLPPLCLRLLILSISAATAFASPHTEGGKKVLVLVSEYPDEPIAKTEAQLQADFENLFKIGQSGGIDEFFRRNSFGKTWFISVKVRKVTLSNPKATYAGNYTAVLTEALSISGENSSAYDRIMSIANGTISSTGLAYAGGKSSFYNSVQNQYIIIHELGHNWGNWHANFWRPNSTDPLDGTSVEYGNAFDNMANGSGDWNGVKKFYLDFLTTNATDGTRLLNVNTTGTYRLAAIDSPSTAPGLVRALRLTRTGSTGGGATRLFIDFRQVQHASNLYSWNGVHLYLDFIGSTADNLIDTNPKTPAPTDEVYDAPLLIGRTFYDPGANVYITPLAKVPGATPPQIDVRLHFGPVSGNRAPSLTISASNSSPAPGTPINLSATASDPDGDQLAYAWDFGDGTFSTDAAANQTKSYSSAGWYRVSCTVTDMRGGTASYATWINVGSNPYREPDTSTPTLSGVYYRYYEGVYSTLPDFTKLLPKKSGVVNTVSLDPKERSDGFAFLFEGYIDVPETDVYTLRIRGDDGFRLYIGNTLVINSNSVKNAVQTVASNVALQAGKHPFRLEFFHRDGAEELSFTWQTVNSSEVEIPASHLARTDFGSNAPPSVVITAPAPNSKFLLGSTVQFLANATDADGIDRVQYFAGSSFIGEATTPPFAVNWENIPVGPKTITALAYDTTGRWATSAPVNFEVVSPPPRQSIGINFNPANVSGASLDWSDIAGAIYPQGNWNNLTGLSGNATNLLDHLGNPSGTSITWQSSGNSNYVENLTTADTSTAAGKLFKGLLEVRGDETGRRPTASLTGVPYREYDVYVYFDMHLIKGDAQVMKFTLTPSGGTALAPRFGRNSASTADGLGDYPNYDTWIGFKESTATSANATAVELFGNYVVFRGITSPGFTVTVDSPTGANANVGFNAIQIVESIPESPRIYLSTPNVSLTEGGPSASYSISLGFPPTGNITITISPDAQLTADKTSLVFTPENWATPQFVTLRAVNDTIPESSPHNGIVTHTLSAEGTNYNGLTIPSVTASITDDDAPAIIVESAILPAREGSSPVPTAFTFTRTGSVSYTDPVTVYFTMSKPSTSGADLNEYTLSGSSGVTVTYNNATGNGSVVLPAGQVSARVLLTPVNDSTAEGVEFATLTVAPGAGYRVGSPSTATAAIRDDDRRDWLTQYFAIGQLDTTFDLNGKKLTFHPDPNGPAEAPYHVTISNATTFSTPYSGHVSLKNSTYTFTGNYINGYWTVNSGYPVKFFGTTYNTIFIGVDGWLRLSGPDSTGNFSLETHLSRKQIAAFFAQLTAEPVNQTYTVDVYLGRVTTPGEERTVVTWVNLTRQDNPGALPQYLASFQLECWDNGTITISWPSIGATVTSSNTVIVGLANGNGTAPSPLPSGSALENFSSAPQNVTDRPPVFNTVPSLVTTVGTPYTYAISASHIFETPPAISATVLSAWLTITDHGNGTATLSGTPPTLGQHAVTLRASGPGGFTEQSFSILVEPSGGNIPPVFTSSPPTSTFAPGAAFSYSITTTDANGTTPVLFATRLPSWLTFTDNGNGTATLSGTVPDFFIDRYYVEIGATDNIATTAQAFSINIDHPPLVAIHSPARRAIILPDRADTLLLEASAEDPERSSVSLGWSVLSAPAGASVAFSSPSSASTSATFSAPGRYRLRFSASDSTSTASSDLDVFVESNANTTVLNNGLLGYWPVSEASGLTMVSDASGNNQTLTLGTGLDSVIASGGISGNAASFAGTANSFAEVQNFNQPATISLSFWLRPTAAPATSEQTVISINRNGDPRIRIYRQSGSSRLRVFAYFSSTSGVWEIPSDLPAGQWTHVVVAYDYSSTSSNPVAYINGTAVSVNKITAPSGSRESTLNRIRLADGNNARLNGMLDEIRVYHALISSTDVAALYNRTGERTTDLAAHWKFDEAVGTTVAADYSGNSRTLYVGSGVSALTTTAGYEGNGIIFNAADSFSLAQATLTQPNQVTVALWFQVGNSPSSTEANLWTLLNVSNPRLRVYRPANDRRLRIFSDWGSTDGVWRIERDIPSNQWIHLAVAYDRSSPSNSPVVYLNGEPVPITAVTSPSGSQQSAANTLRLGADSSGNNRWLGRIDELRIYNRIVPADEIPMLMLPRGINEAPNVDAGPTVETAANNTITLAGSATDDGRPAAEILFTWSLLSGPSGSSFGSPTNPNSSFTTGPQPGTYRLVLSATDGEATVLQNTSVIVPAPRNTFADWVATYATLGSANGPLDDPDGDGVPNLLEYALGSRPDEASSRILPVVATSGNHLTLAFTPQNTTGLRYIVEASSDLLDWSERHDITTLITPGQLYIYEDSANLSTTQRRFLRLRVEMDNP